MASQDQLLMNPNGADADAHNIVAREHVETRREQRTTTLYNRQRTGLVPTQATVGHVTGRTRPDAPA